MAFINEDYWVSGSDEGGLALWTVGKKKPLTQFAKAHAGCDLRSIWTPDGVDPPRTQAHWISAVAGKRPVFPLESIKTHPRHSTILGPSVRRSSDIDNHWYQRWFI